MEKTADSAQMIPVSYNVYYFSAPWCAPCQTFGPLIESVSQDYPNANIIKFNMDEEEAQMWGLKHGVTSIPHLATDHAHELRGAVNERVLRTWFDHVEAVEGVFNEIFNTNSGV